MAVHQPAHHGVHHLFGEALDDGHTFIFLAPTMNEAVHQPICPSSLQIHDGQDDGHIEPAQISHSSALSIIFLLSSKRKKEERRKALPKAYAREGGHGRQAFILSHPERAS